MIPRPPGQIIWPTFDDPAGWAAFFIVHGARRTPRVLDWPRMREGLKAVMT